jgi:hypothetical protein
MISSSLSRSLHEPSKFLRRSSDTVSFVYSISILIPTSSGFSFAGYAGTQQGYTGPEQGYGQQAGGANPGAYAQTGTGQDYQSGYQAGYQAGYQVGYQAAYTAYAGTSGGGVGAGADVGGDVMAGAEDVLEASEPMPMGTVRIRSFI